MHPDPDLNTIAHQDLPLRQSILPAFSEAQPRGEAGVFLGRENMVSTGTR